MSSLDALTRITQIQSQIAALDQAFDPAQMASASTQAASSVTALPAQAAGTSSTFADALAQAQSPAQVQASGLSAAAKSQLTTDQQQFASRLSADTGLNPQVIAAWLLAEESGGAAQSRQSANNNDWLNIGYTDSGTYGSADSVWSDPLTAADATAGWLKGQDTIPGYGTASSGIQAILNSVNQSPQAQIAAIQNSGWASSGYGDLPALYSQVGGT